MRTIRIWAVILLVLFSSQTLAQHSRDQILPQFGARLGNVCSILLIGSWKKPNTKYTLYPMALRYHIWDLNNAKYLSDQELAEREIVFSHELGKWIYKVSQELVELGEYIFVMDGVGRIYIEKGIRRLIHHSSLTNGGGAAAAGELTFDDKSQLRRVLTDTGHYYRNFPTPSALWEPLIVELTERNVDISRLVVDEFLGRENVLDAPPRLLEDEDQ